MSARFTPDGTPMVTPSSFPEVCAFVVAGAADSSVGRGKGAPFVFAADPAQTTVNVFTPQSFSLTWSFLDYVMISGGTISYDGAAVGDTLDFFVQCPASTVTPSATNSGDCNLVAVDATRNLIVPAPGNGAYTLVTSNPFPAWDSTPSMNLSGHWEWCDVTIASSLTSAGATASPDNTPPPNAGMGAVLPTIKPGHGSYHMMTSTVVLERFMILMPLQGTRTIRFSPNIKPKKVLPHWQFVGTLQNSGHAGLRVSWVLEIGRVYTT
jgi:hypothetical protein